MHKIVETRAICTYFKIPMQKVRFFLVWFLCSSGAQAVQFDRPFYNQVYAAIENYFVSSYRRVDQIEIGQPRLLQDRKYIIEGTVIAQAAYSQSYISYHCGVFFGRAAKRTPPDNNSWVIDFVTCEARQ